MSKQRISWIDAAKGIGIIAIVLGHGSNGVLRCVCLSFNSIIFFVLAGLTFCRKTEAESTFLCFDDGRDFKTFLRSSFKTLAVPYLFWGIISIFVYFFFGRLTADKLNMEQSHFEILPNLISLLYGNSDTGYFEWNRPLWFLPCLLAVELLWFWALKISVNRDAAGGKKWGIYVTAMLLSASNMAFIFFSGYKFILPFELETAISMVFFFGIGLILRDGAFLSFVKKHVLEKKKVWQYLYILCGAGLTIALSAANGLTDTRSDQYVNLPIYVVNALCACFTVLLLAKVAPRSPILEYMGQKTMAILVMHKFPIMFVRVILPQVDKKISEGNLLYELLVCAFAIGSCLIVEKVISMAAPQVFGKAR